MYLLGVFHDLGLPQDVYLDLSGVFQLVFDALGQLPGQNDHLVLGYLLGLHHHADLAAGLNGVALFHAGIAAGDLLQLFQALDIVLQVLPPGAGTGSGNGVGRLDQAGHQGLALHVVVVCLDGVDDVLLLPVLPAELHTQGHMGALHLMVHSLADIVQQTRPLGGLHVGAQLGGHQAGNVADLDGVLQNVLTVAGAVPQAAQHFLQLRVQAPDAGLQHGALALGAIRFVLENGAFDRARVGESITGFELMEKGAQPWNVDKVAQATGLSEDAVTAFYRTLAESPRTIIWMGGCLSRYTNGLQSIRAIIALQALRDNLIGSGRGLLTMEGGKPEGEKEFVDAVCGPAKDSGVNFRRLLNTMKKGNLDVLFLNSSYRRYPDCTGVAEAIKKVGFVVHRGFFKTEEMDVAELFVPAAIAPEIAEELHRMTRIAYRACRCSGVVRVDFIVTPEGKPYLIEINSIPGMSAGSIVPKQARAMGMSLGEMFDLIIADTCRK